jgi:hypothetical protein
MFETFEKRDKTMIYHGLLCLVKSNSGVGFCNHDQGHSAYAVGRDGKSDYQTFGDSPEHNRLFKMMRELSAELCAGDLDGSSEIGDYIYTWSDFCRIAYEAYEKDKREQ